MIWRLLQTLSNQPFRIGQFSMTQVGLAMCLYCAVKAYADQQNSLINLNIDVEDKPLTPMTSLPDTSVLLPIFRSEPVSELDLSLYQQLVVNETQIAVIPAPKGANHYLHASSKNKATTLSNKKYIKIYLRKSDNDKNPDAGHSNDNEDSGSGYILVLAAIGAGAALAGGSGSGGSSVVSTIHVESGYSNADDSDGVYAQGGVTVIVGSINQNSQLTLNIPDPRIIEGPAGAAGQDGNDGEDGNSAYEMAVSNGYSGSEAAWLSSLQGADGDDGDDGDDGTDGADGVSIVNVSINDDGDLIVSLSNGEDINAGTLPQVPVGEASVGFQYREFNADSLTGINQTKFNQDWNKDNDGHKHVDNPLPLDTSLDPFSTEAHSEINGADPGENIVWSEIDPSSSPTINILEGSQDYYAYQITDTLQFIFSETADYSWNFHLNSDDGSLMFINDAVIINNNGIHDDFKKESNHTFAGGEHDFVVTYFDRSGNPDTLELTFSPTDNEDLEFDFSSNVVVSDYDGFSLSDVAGDRGGAITIEDIIFHDVNSPVELQASINEGVSWAAVSIDDIFDDVDNTLLKIPTDEALQFEFSIAGHDGTELVTIFDDGSAREASVGFQYREFNTDEYVGTYGNNKFDTDWSATGQHRDQNNLPRESNIDPFSAAAHENLFPGVTETSDPFFWTESDPFSYRSIGLLDESESKNFYAYSISDVLQVIYPESDDRYQWNFNLASDDSSLMFVNDDILLDHHWTESPVHSNHPMLAGAHDFLLTYFEFGGPNSLELTVSPAAKLNFEFDLSSNIVVSDDNGFSLSDVAGDRGGAITIKDMSFYNDSQTLTNYSSGVDPAILEYSIDSGTSWAGVNLDQSFDDVGNTKLRVLDNQALQFEFSIAGHDGTELVSIFDDSLFPSSSSLRPNYDPAKLIQISKSMYAKLYNVTTSGEYTDGKIESTYIASNFDYIYGDNVTLDASSIQDFGFAIYDSSTGGSWEELGTYDTDDDGTYSIDESDLSRIQNSVTENFQQSAGGGQTDDWLLFIRWGNNNQDGGIHMSHNNGGYADHAVITDSWFGFDFSG